jgi:dipeptide/tripeptide permease
MAKHQYATKPPNISTMPPGVPYIIGNEAAERFSFYGMRSILIVFMTTYMVNKLGMPDRMGDAEARGYFSMFVSAVYFLPILGAILAECFLGKYNTIFWLSLVYCAGHFALALNDTRVGLMVGLGLIALGSGGIKPCVSANVGDQFGDSNKHLLSKVFGWFYFSINAGSFLSTILCPILLNSPNWGPRYAFGLPGVAMVIATIFFWAGRKKFVHIPPAGTRFLRQFFVDGLGVLGLPFVLPALSLGRRPLSVSGADDTGTIELADMRKGQASRPSAAVLVLGCFLIAAFFMPWIRGTGLSGYDLARSGSYNSLAWLVPTLAGAAIALSVVRVNNRLIGAAAGVVPLLAVVYGVIQIFVEAGRHGFGAAANIFFHVFSIGAYLTLLAGIGIILAAIVPPIRKGAARDVYGNHGVGALGRLFIVYIFVAVFWSLWDQSSGGAWTLQCRKMDLHFLGMNLLPEQVQTANPIMILLFIPLVNYVIYPFMGRFFFVTPLRKIGIGLGLTACSYLVIAYIQTLIDAGGRPSLWWQMLAYAILTMGEAMVSITGLEFSYTQAPNKMKSAVMAAWLFTVSLGNQFTAQLNFFISNPDGSSKMSDFNYYMFFAILMFVTTGIFAIVARFYRGKTHLQSQEVTPDERATEPVLSSGAPT